MFVLGKRRLVDPDKVALLVESIRQIGLQTPITVRQTDEDYIDPNNGDDLGTVFALVVGRHRLEAMRQIGAEFIDAIVMDQDAITARKWEIAENLHRAELTALERDEQLAEWVRLTEGNAFQAETHKKRGQRPGGINAAARELGLSKADAHRAVKVADLCDEAKQTARDLGLDDNRSALLEAAKATEPSDQVGALTQRATRKSAPLAAESVPDESTAAKAERERQRREFEESERRNEARAVAQTIAASLDATAAAEVYAYLTSCCDTDGAMLLLEAIVEALEPTAPADDGIPPELRRGH